MKTIEKIKKNGQLSKAEKKELIEFWTNYKCPIEGDRKIIATYPDEEPVIYTVAEKLDFFYDETPSFIQNFFTAMAEGREYRTRFGSYKPLSN